MEEGKRHVTDWLTNQGWCWGIEIPPHTAPELARYLQEQGFTVIGQIHAHPKTRAWHWERQNKKPPDINTFIDLLRNVNKEPPCVQFFMEDDSAGVGFSAAYLRTPPRSHVEAKTMFDNYLESAMKERQAFLDVRCWAMAGFAGTAHHYARHGADCIIIERANDDVEDLQTAIAFARGAAHQFTCEWGIDLSLWWGVIYGCVQHLNPSLYTRHLWLSYVGGAQVFRIEGGDLLVEPQGPTTVAKAIAKFASTAQKFNPGVPDAPIAVVLPSDHGWITPPYWRTTNEAWNYARLPYRQGDRSIDGFFKLAFPAASFAQDPFPFGNYRENDPPASPFALSSITPEFAPSPEHVFYAEPPIPFGTYANRSQAREEFVTKAKDPSPYRVMGDSRWGDIFDVLTDDVSLETLSHYPVIVVLGQVDLSGERVHRLQQYVEQGGSLLVAAGTVSPEQAKLWDISFLPELRTGRAWQWYHGEYVHEAFRYCPLAITSDGAMNILAQAHNHDPIVVSRKIGMGVVYLCLIPWFEGASQQLAGPVVKLLDVIIRPLQPVIVEGPPAAWVSARDEKGFTLALANHADCDWHGTIHAALPVNNISRCYEIIAGDVITYQNESGCCVLQTVIPPFDVRVFRWEF